MLNACLKNLKNEKYYFVLYSKSSQNEIKNQIKSDQVELLSTDDEIVINSNESVNGGNSKLYILSNRFLNLKY